MKKHHRLGVQPSSGAVSWSSKKQEVTVLSNTEAEYIAATSAACQGVWLRRLLSDMGVVQSKPTILFCDNKSTISIAKNLSMHGRSKHIDIHYHFIRNLQEEEVISLNYCNTAEQLANIFTKGLIIQKHENFHFMLGLRSFEARESVDNAQELLSESSS